MQSSATSKNAYDNIVYYQNLLLKKEGLNSWVEYWAVIRGRWLLFYEPVEKGARPTKLVKTLELPNGTKCSMVPRSKRRFPFSLNNGHGSYYLKCETELQRYTWVVSTLLAATGQPPKPVPRSVPKDFAESTIDPKMAKFGKKLEHSNQKLESKKTGQKTNNVSKHRIRYAQRLESKAKRYLSKSEEDLRPSCEESDDEIEARRPYSARDPRQHYTYSKGFKDSYSLGAGAYGTRNSDIKSLRRTSSHSSSSIEIHAQVHSPDPMKMSSKYPVRSIEDEETPVMSIVQIDNDEYGTVHVISPDDALPNMVVEERKRAVPKSARTNKENDRSRGLTIPHQMVHSHSMNDLGKTNQAMSMDDEVVRIEAMPLGTSNRTRTGLSGLSSPRITNKKNHAETVSKEKAAERFNPRKGNSPRSPVPKSRYSRYNIPSSEA
ncbi:uncharacterized protein LOC135685233 [Rhopilema esculentum]|uniref:uncharacterized protein LOC135685233 n=1 Tax=Rhopilema esculentum TaxID=499914 RepID=UPI0031D089E2|eukprot:gene17235-8792_t